MYIVPLAPETACKIINTCVVLCIEYNVPEPEDTDEAEGLKMNVEVARYQDNECDDMNRVNVELGEGRAVRRFIIDEYFR